MDTLAKGLQTGAKQQTIRYAPLNQQFNVPFTFSVQFTQGTFELDNRLFCDALKLRETNTRARVLPVIDSEVHAHHPELLSCIRAYFQHYKEALDLIDQPLIVRGGEICKDDPIEVNALLSLTVEQKIDRHSYILVIGGGAVLDAMGYACAIAHRGIRIIRMPTTVLAQNDAGIGVKNAINYKGRKNYIGTFAPPALVINDSRFLTTLDDRDKRAGLAEAVKVALIRDREFFLWLERHADQLAAFDTETLQTAIYECARLHLQHITQSGDPFEMGSARPLDFGHWCAHRLEEIDDKGQRLRHGEAVAIGIALDSLYSGMIEPQATASFAMEDAERIIRLLQTLGFTLNHSNLEQLDIATALSHFREHLGGKLCITLLKAFGCAYEASQISIPVMERAVKRIGSSSSPAQVPD